MTTQSEAKDLKVVVEHLGVDRANAGEVLNNLRNAATEEYLEMLRGSRVFTRGQDIREYRLFLLIKHYFKTIPSDGEVSALFQTTATQSRGLLRAVTSKYQYDLNQVLTQALRKLLKSAKNSGENGTFWLTPTSEYMVEELNRRLAIQDPSAVRIRRLPGTVLTFVITSGSKSALEIALQT